MDSAVHIIFSFSLLACSWEQWSWALPLIFFFSNPMQTGNCYEYMSYRCSKAGLSFSGTSPKNQNFTMRPMGFVLRSRNSEMCKERPWKLLLPHACIHARTPSVLVPSVLWHCWLGDRKGIRPVKNSPDRGLRSSPHLDLDLGWPWKSYNRECFVDL